MNDFVDLNKLVETAIKDSDYKHMHPVIVKELLHYDILYALDQEGLLDTLTFQGGTCLRLCYGSSRFSEDLDFAGGSDFSIKDVRGIKACIEDYLGKRYGLETEVKEPSELSLDPRNADINVEKWQIKITTSPERKDLPKQKIKLEIANIPAYTRNPVRLHTNYDFLPDGYNTLVILT